jgi:hypothetical protein
MKERDHRMMSTASRRSIGKDKHRIGGAGTALDTAWLRQGTVSRDGDLR